MTTCWQLLMQQLRLGVGLWCCLSICRRCGLTMERHGVLLYYSYRSLDAETTQPAMAAWFRENCALLGLRGRVRVALDGINVTLGGRWDALHQVRACMQFWLGSTLASWA